MLEFILVTGAFHFLNVIKDLEWDLTQKVLGAPQRLGKKVSVLIATGLVLIAVLLAVIR